MKGIHAIYFSYNRDAKMLMASIKSLQLCCQGLKSITIVQDGHAPFEEEDRDEIREMSSVPLTIRTSGEERNRNIKGLGWIRLMQIYYANISANADPDDYIFKIDSDVLVTSGWVFDYVLEHDFDAVGVHPAARKAFVPANHFGGVGYFIRCGVAVDLHKTLLPEDIDKWEILDYPEDMVNSSVLAEITDRVQIFPNFQQNSSSKYFTDTFLQRVDKELALKNAFVHCRSNEGAMLKLYEEIYD